MSDSNSERFDGKTHVPDEASNNTFSGTVCKHCGKDIEVRTFGWQHKGQYLCLANLNGGKHEPVAEPALAEQPRESRGQGTSTEPGNP